MKLFFILILVVSISTLLLSKFTLLNWAESLSISLICWGFIATIYEISSNKNPELQIANRYRYKALWYGVVSFSSIAIFIANFLELLSEGLLVFNIIIVFIAIHECIDNILSFKAEKQKLNKKRPRTKKVFTEIYTCNKQQQSQLVRAKNDNDKIFQKESEIGILKSIFIAFLITIIGIIASQEKK